MTSLENAQLKMECLKMAERLHPNNEIEWAMRYYQWITSVKERSASMVQFFKSEMENQKSADRL